MKPQTPQTRFLVRIDENVENEKNILVTEIRTFGSWQNGSSLSQMSLNELKDLYKTIQDYLESKSVSLINA